MIAGKTVVSPLDSGVFLLIDGTRAMTGNLNMSENNIINANDVNGGSLATDGIRIRNNSQDNPTVWATDGYVDLNGRIKITGFTDLTASGAVFVLMDFNETMDATGQSLVIPQAFWYTPTIQYDTLQSFGGSSVFQDGSIWTETAQMLGSHTSFSIGSFLGGLRYKVGHAGSGVAPLVMFGFGASPGADALTGSLTCPRVSGYETNQVFALKAFLALEEFRNGVVVTEYSHYRANSDIPNGLVLQGGSTILTEIGLDLQNINHGTTNMSVKSTGVNAYMHHAGQIRILSDTNGLILGAGQDASIIYDGTNVVIDPQIIGSGGVLILSMKSGATQGAAGAAVNELWKTASHATLPDNVAMVGV